MNVVHEAIPIGEALAPRNEKVAPADYPELPYIGLDDIEAHSMRLLGSKSAASMKSSAKRFYPGDVLYSRLRPYLNKVWPSDRSGICSSEFIVMPGNQLVDPSFLALRLNAMDFVSFANSLNAGDRPRVDFDQFSSFRLPPFPLGRQRRIVAKIEDLFSELDKGVESLKTARAKLRVYRQAVLKHAFEGKLTAQWRKENKDKRETVEHVLANIEKERGRRYEQQLHKWNTAVEGWEADGKWGKKPRKPTKVKELPLLTEVELSELPKLPEGWQWVKYGILTEIVKNGISQQPKGEKGEKIFRISAVRPMNFNMDDYRYIEAPHGSLADYQLQKGDVVFTRYNGSRKLVGVGAEYRSEEKRVFPDKLIQTRIFSKYMSSGFIEKAVNAGASRRFIESRTRTTAGQSGISGSDIKAIPIPLCPRGEQVEVSQILASKLSAVDQLENAIERILQETEALRQSVLKKAFSGQLVPQDPNDEPASVLLERMRAEREKTEENNRSRKKTKKKTPA